MADHIGRGRGRSTGRGGRSRPPPPPIGTPSPPLDITPGHTPPTPHTPDMPATATSAPAFMDTDSVPATPTSFSVQQRASLPAVPGRKDPIDGKTWIAPGLKHDYMPVEGPIRDISRIIKSKYEIPWPTWMKVNDNIRDMWFEEFKKKYKWLPNYSSTIIRDIFEHKGSAIFKDIMHKLRSGKDKGKWISPEVRQGLENYWNGEEFKKKSAIGKKNRAVDSGASLYTGGSVSTAVIRKRLILELGREPTAFEIMGKTKKNKEGKWANEKAENLASDYIHRRNVARESQPLKGELDVDLTVTEENALFLEVVGGPNKKGHVYGLGQLGEEFVASYSQSSSLSNPTSALDYEAMMAALNAKLAEKDLKIDRINNELADKDRKIEQFGTKLKETQGLVQQLIQCVAMPRSSFTSAQPTLDPASHEDES